MPTMNIVLLVVCLNALTLLVVVMELLRGWYRWQRRRVRR